ncbi:AI-2E family transporter [Candidatus Dojkabacteria bacterium]|nr:AI-2E family transporter [Candidatus Dojkabacteria bacterium]
MSRSTKTNMINHKYFFYILLVVILFLTYLLISSYIPLVIFSFLTAVLVSPLYDYIYKITKQKKLLSTSISIFIVFLCFFVPLLFVGNMIINQANDFQEDLQTYIYNNQNGLDDSLNLINERIQKLPGVNIELTEEGIATFIQDSVDSIINLFISNFTNITFSSINFVGNLIIYILLFAHFLPNKEKIINYIKLLSPLDDEIDDMYIKRVFAMANSMLKGTLLIAFVQASVSGIVLWLFGVDYVIFWTILMIILGIIPMIGTSFISVPIGIALILAGHVFEGIFIALFSLVVVSQIDNLMRATLIPKDAKIHPMLLLLSLVGGIKLFAGFGFLYGPLIMILLVTTIEVYLKYYKKKD